MILSTTTIGCISSINASVLNSNMYNNDNTYKSQLQELFANQNNTLLFNNGFISCNNQILDTDDYTQVEDNDSSNTIYINTNTLPVSSNSGGIFTNIAASMKGSNNISLQDFDNTNIVPNSITFSGDNSQYYGTLYLHPNIDTITFNTNNSIINRLNIPSINNQIRDITVVYP